MQTVDTRIDSSPEKRPARRPRPRPIDMGQVKIFNIEKFQIGSQSHRPGKSTAGAEELSAATQKTSLRHETRLLSEVYKLDLNETHISTLEELGAGASGNVYRVAHHQSKTIMAKKVIPLLDMAVSKEIMRELHILNKCISPDIVSLFGAYQHDGQICICMEYMDVGSLEKISKFCGRISECYLLKITVSVLKGLDYLFQHHRIIHRDIKPSNILINSEGQVKICDFGVSATLESTLANTFVGTGAYMSPERITGEKYSVQCDVWSLGLTLLELGLGRYPFHPPGGEDIFSPLPVFDLIQRIIRDTLPTLPQNEYSTMFQEFVDTCLAKDAKSRPSPSFLLKNHPISNYAANLQVDMATWARSFLSPNLNEKQIQRWSVTQAQKRQSWINALERRKSGFKVNSSLQNGMAGLSLEQSLSATMVEEEAD